MKRIVIIRLAICDCQHEIESFGNRLASEFGRGESEWTLVYFGVGVGGVPKRTTGLLDCRPGVFGPGIV